MNIRVCDICGDQTKEMISLDLIHHLEADEFGEHDTTHRKKYDLCTDCLIEVQKETIKSLVKYTPDREELLCKIIDQKAKERNTK